MLRLVGIYVFCILVVWVIMLPMLLLRERLSTSIVALLFLLPVLLNTTLWGLAPGLATGVAAFLVFNYFFLAPYYTFTVHQSQDLLALVIFFAVSILVSQLMGRAQKNLTEAVGRERELVRLYDFSKALIGFNTAPGIASVIAAHVQDTLLVQRVELYLDAIAGNTSFLVGLPEGQPTPETRPDILLALETPRGLLGELRLWRAGQPLQPAEERVLHTFVVQGALALERAALSQAEGRARILEESDRMKSALLSSVSHELRTPLATIKAAATSLLSGEVDWDTEARAELLDVVDEESDHLNYLVGNLLDMSRIEVGALQPDRRWCELSEIIDSAVRRLWRMLRQHQLLIDLPEDLPSVAVDFAQMERVFVNLLSNSVKYAPPGTQITVRSQAPSDAWLFVQVANQGPPVPPDQLEHIFERFHRITNAGQISGTGLGLSICKGIIDAHGGRLWAENLPQAFAFNLLLPLELDGRPASPLQAAPGDEGFQ